ncbi:Caspase-3 precursor-like [Arapaima gigas]
MADREETSDEMSSGELPSHLQYSMSHRHVGKCLIISNRCFSGLPYRNGAEKDEERLKHTFEALGFTLQVEKNLSAGDMLRVLQSVSKEDHSQRSCFVCVILTHGYEEHVLGTDRNAVPVRDLTAQLTAQRCPSLQGKPKLFFIQACRGEEYDSGVETDSVAVKQKSCVKLSDTPEMDFLCGYSTPPGYFSWRNQATGSVYIRGLCLMLEQHKSLEITKILTRVNHWVALHFESQTDSELTGRKKQMPCVMSRLTKELYLQSHPQSKQGSTTASNSEP